MSSEINRGKSMMEVIEATVKALGKIKLPPSEIVKCNYLPVPATDDREKIDAFEMGNKLYVSPEVYQGMKSYLNEPTS